MKKFMYLLLAVFLFCIDFFVKYLVINNIEFNTQVTVIPTFFYLTFVKNTGAAFSSFQNSTTLLVVCGFAATSFLIYSIFDKKTSNLEKLCFSVMIAGILGNLFDRVYYGYVIDMFSFNLFGYVAPIFNVADIFIVVGTIGWIISMCTGGVNENNK